MGDFWKLAQNPPKSDKRIKQTCWSPFWGDVAIEKWSPFFCSGTRSAIFSRLKTGTFTESARFQVLKNGTLNAGTKKRRPLFNGNIPPKWWLTRLFYAFITFGWVLSQFSKIAHLWPFFSRFYLLNGQKTKSARLPRKMASNQKMPIVCRFFAVFTF